MILEQIVEKRREQLDAELRKTPRIEIERAASFANTPVRDFEGALTKNGISVIAEVKKASPSKGVICGTFDPRQIALDYEAAGADAISVLTEEHYFMGNAAYLERIKKAVKIPVLRKDFIFDSYQIYEARVMGADAFLLIVSILPKETLQEFLSLAKFLSLSALVEVHDEKEAETALDCGARIIGINNRDLRTFDVTLRTTKRIAAMIPEDRVLVSESGIVTHEDLCYVEECGADAVLIGETLMRSREKQKTLKTLRFGA